MASSRLTPAKKVRLACQRCRVRRIKCDGQVPSCGNCSKAGEPCVDVHSQNQDILIPRNFAHAARARIKWLEDIIRERLPDVDLDEGPHISPLPAWKSSETVLDPAQHVAPLSSSYPNDAAIPSDNENIVDQPQTGKRRLTSDGDSENEEFLPERAQSIAVNLGLLSLNSDSSQKHYLGSSSGLLFSNLIAVSPSNAEDTPDTSLIGRVSHPFHRPVQAEAGRRRFEALQALLKQNLPQRHDARILIQCYLRETHPDFPVLDPASLLDAADALYHCIELDAEAISTSGWPSAARDFRWNGRSPSATAVAGKLVPLPVIAFILLMVFNIAALVQVRLRVYEYSPERFYRGALQFSQHCFSQISISSIQAVVTLIIHSILNPAEVHLWTLIHIAMAQCVELGIHRKPQEPTPEGLEVQQINRFVFYTVYSLDRSVSTIQGRPLGFRDETFDVQLPQQLHESVGNDPDLIPQFFSANVVRYSTHHYILDRIVSEIKSHLYLLPGKSVGTLWTEPKLQQSQLNAKLQSWWTKVSGNEFRLLGLDPGQRQAWLFKLKLRYHTTMVLLHQPSQAIRDPSVEALQTCFDSASAILQTYQRLSDDRRIHFGWRTVQNIFAAGATLIYTFWTCPQLQQNTSIIELSRNFRTCSNLLSVGGEWWPSLKAGKRSLESVADLTMRRLYSLEMPSKHRRLAGGSASYFVTQGSNAVPSASEAAHGDLLHSTGLDSGQELGFASSQSAPDAWLGYSDTATSQPSSRLDHASELQQTYNQERWQEAGSGGPAVSLRDASAMFPEVSNFLADFDNSDFSWNFPLNADSHLDFFDFSMDSFGRPS